MDNFDNELHTALYKRAKGFFSQDVVEEYTLDENGSEVLNKKKVTKKYNPPDMTAVKILLDRLKLDRSKYAKMTQSELKCEEKRLLKKIKGEKKSEN